MRRWTPLALLAAFAVAGPAAAADEPVSLERTLVRAAHGIMKYCRDHNYKNVGVLKFLVHKAGQDALTDNAGTLNRTVARQLEMGLILANDVNALVGVIEEASDMAAKTPGANHLTKEGRLKLLDATYPLAWGKNTVKADALLTGVVRVSADLKTLRITVLAFDKATNALAPVGPELVAATDPRKLSEIGESFSRGAFDDGSVEPTAKREKESVEWAAKVKDKTAPWPGTDPTAPVRLEIYYDGRPVPIEVRDGKAYAPEPMTGQAVTFRLTRTAAAKGSVACALKVNGENTLGREKLPDLQCRKWLLYPTPGTVEVAGFQIDDHTSERFRVLSRAESKAREMDYGADVGTVTLTVFGEWKGRQPAGDNSDETRDTTVLEKAKLPAAKDNFDVLLANLLRDGESRGLIADGGARVANQIRVVKFNQDPTPVMSLTVVYYKK